MKASNMPAPNEMVWYKWFPVKAMTSLRFGCLSLAEEGFYRRLYDLASIAQPSDRRGWVYEHDRPASAKEIALMLKVREKRAEQILNRLLISGLVARDENGAWGIPNFAKHQRGANLQWRKDGLGTAEAERIRNRTETESRQNRVRILTDAEADTDADTDGGVNITPPSSSENCELTNLVNQFIQKSKWVSDGEDTAVYRELKALMERGDDVSAAISKHVVPDMKPWQLRDILHPPPTKESMEHAAYQAKRKKLQEIAKAAVEAENKRLADAKAGV